MEAVVVVGVEFCNFALALFEPTAIASCERFPRVGAGVVLVASFVASIKRLLWRRVISLAPRTPFLLRPEASDVDLAADLKLLRTGGVGAGVAALPSSG